MAEVRLDRITKQYDNNIYGAREITFNVGDEEFVVLVGPSGCGKTTVLRLIAGLEEITSGKIFINGHCVNNVPPKMRDIAMVFQNYALYPHMTVYDNMAFGLKMRKIPSCEIKKRVEQAAKILGIEELLNRKPRQLSGGQRQRVAVGRAIVRQPKVFLFDEPLSNLDAKLRVQMRAEISRLHQKLKATVIYVTHDQIEAMTLGQKIVILKDAIIQQIAEPMTLYNKPKNKFVAGFIGSPPMNFIDGIIQKRDKRIEFTSPNITFSLDNRYKGSANREVIIGIRPEDFFLNKNGKIKILVDVVEPMGNNLYVHGRCGKTTLSIQTSKEVHFQIGEYLQLKPNLEKLYIFDKKTTEAIWLNTEFIGS